MGVDNCLATTTSVVSAPLAASPSGRHREFRISLRGDAVLDNDRSLQFSTTMVVTTTRSSTCRVLCRGMAMTTSVPLVGEQRSARQTVIRRRPADAYRDEHTYGQVEIRFKTPILLLLTGILPGE